MVRDALSGHLLPAAIDDVAKGLVAREQRDDGHQAQPWYGPQEADLLCIALQEVRRQATESAPVCC